MMFFLGTQSLILKKKFNEKIYTKKSLLRNRMMNEMFNEITRPILLEDDLNSMKIFN